MIRHAEETNAMSSFSYFFSKSLTVRYIGTMHARYVDDGDRFSVVAALETKVKSLPFVRRIVFGVLLVEVTVVDMIGS